MGALDMLLVDPSLSALGIADSRRAGSHIECQFSMPLPLAPEEQHVEEREREREVATE